jgi:uncharacterized protein (TIGR00290 family)
MVERRKVAVAWSGGKDSAVALQRIRADGRYEIVSLLTTVTGEYDRISMHGVRRELLLRQAENLGLPLVEAVIPPQCTNELYERQMADACEGLAGRGVTAIAFGDLYLEDVRAYREKSLAPTGLEPLFPVWQEPVDAFAREVLGLGVKATLVCVDSEQIPGAFAGRDYDERLLAELPATADPCGEKGEFHTFVSDGPFFSEPVRFAKGDVTVRDGRFWYCDLLPA